MKIDVCFSPALYPVYHNPESVVVVVDVFRATTTIAAAFNNGAASIRPVATVQEAQAYKAEGWLVGAERNVRRCDFADFGNSPSDYSADKVADNDLVFTTTNGTKSITAARDAYKVITGAFVNLAAVEDYCFSLQKDVVVLCSGWEDKINLEDTLFGGALTERLLRRGYTLQGDSAFIANELWRNHLADIPALLQSSEHMRRLEKNGLAGDADYCLQLDRLNVVPELTITDDVLILYNASKSFNEEE